jgi:predicted amidohydrolase
LKKNITLAIIQPDLHWEAPGANLSFFEQEVMALEETPDLVVLPETFTTGFTMNVEDHADGEGKTIAWMREMAAQKGCVMAGSAIIREEGRYFNRLLWVEPSGKVQHYDKRHLFRMGREQLHFSPGNRRVVVTLASFRILLQVCYDLRFPVFARNRGDYDAILYVANWPTARQPVWETLLTARALENQAYVIAANRCGTDGEGMDNCGLSRVIDPRGNIKARLDDQPGVLISSLDLEELRLFRNNFPAHEDADDFQLLL